MIRAAVFGLALSFICGQVPVRLQENPEPVRPDDFILVKTMEVAGGPESWTDTGLDVVVDQEFWFEASGLISLQAGNPEADCGPEGINIRLMQQPVPDRNLGCLVGRVLQAVEEIEDPQTKEKTVKEYGVAFFIGKTGPARIPADGRLFLGPNENVTGDNTGTFTVRIYRRG